MGKSLQKLGEECVADDMRRRKQQVRERENCRIDIIPRFSLTSSQSIFMQLTPTFISRGGELINATQSLENAEPHTLSLDRRSRFYYCQTAAKHRFSAAMRYLHVTSTRLCGRDGVIFSASKTRVTHGYFVRLTLDDNAGTGHHSGGSQ